MADEHLTGCREKEIKAVVTLKHSNNGGGGDAEDLGEDGGKLESPCTAAERKRQCPHSQKQSYPCSSDSTSAYTLSPESESRQGATACISLHII